jgi:hypothetical protein
MVDIRRHDWLGYSLNVLAVLLIGVVGLALIVARSPAAVVFALLVIAVWCGHISLRRRLTTESADQVQLQADDKTHQVTADLRADDEASGGGETAEQARAELQHEVTSLQQQPPSFEELGGEAVALLQEAGHAAEQLVENARRRADAIIEEAQQQAEQARADVASEAENALEQAREVADHIRREVEEERASRFSETEQVREFREGLLYDLGRVHGEISGLLERTRRQLDQAQGAGGADPKTPAPKAKAGKPAEPTRVAERE